jgi:rSAM/selenodomain-associated transferase 2
MRQKVTISVIIPAQNEQESISKLIAYIKSAARTKAVKQIIVAFNGTDLTAVRAKKVGAVVVAVGSSRSVALNGGQDVATGDILYFLHADSLPPPGWDTLIINAYNAGYHAGTFRLRFDSDHALLRLSAWFTRFSWKFIRFGDQSLFVGREEFIKAGKFNETMIIMEDCEIISRITQFSKFVILPNYLITSARKYQRYGYWRLQSMYLLVIVFYNLRFPQAKIAAIYRKFLDSY